MTATDQFENWRKRLAGDKSVMTYETEPDPGYYRMPITERTHGGGFKKVGWHAVAFWFEDDALFCRVGTRIPLVAAQSYEVWLKAVRYPITEELYFDVVDHGAPWPDMPHEPPAQPAPSGEAAEALAALTGSEFTPGPGHNNPPADPLAAMREQIESAIGAANGLPLTTQAEADVVQSHRSRLNELSNNADNHRKVEKAPHQQAADAVDAKYMPLVKSAKAAADALRVRLSNFATEQAVARRKAEEEAARQRAEADRLAQQRADAEKARLAAMAAGEQPPPLPPPPPPPPPPAPAAAPSGFKGASGKAAGVSMVKFAVVGDWAALAQYYSGNAEVRAVLQKLADRDAKAGNKVPGCTIDEKADVR